MGRSTIRVLIVDDYEPWRRFTRLTLLAYDQLQVIGEAANGSEAIRKAYELKPDLIFLDIGLPEVNGIEAARKIRELSPDSKILFVSENRTWDIAEEALRVAASGYVVKSDAARELLAAVEAVLQGKQFVSPSLVAERITEERVDHSSPQRHEVGFYSDDRGLLEALTQFVGAALRVGNAAIVIATESHRDSLLVRLQKSGLHIDAAVEHGKYIALDAAGALATLMIDGKIDAVRFFSVFDDLIRKAAEAANGRRCHVSIFGECVHLLWARGNAEAAIEMEKLGNQLAKRYDVDILCAYSLTSFQGGIGSHIFEKVCGEHSAVHTW